MSALPVLVIGAGISGLTAAAALGQKGFDVHLIEKRNEISDGGGVGLTLIANAMKALDSIGVAEACVDVGMPADSIAMFRPDGTLLMESPTPRIGGPEWPGGTGITRAAFHAILLEASRAVARITCGVTVAGYDQRGDSVRVRFSNGDTGEYGLVVAADGIYSTMRKALFPDCLPQQTGQAIWRAEVPRPEPVRRTHMFLGGKQALVGLCPVSEEQAYLYIVQGCQPGERKAHETLHDEMVAELEGYGGLVAQCAATLDDPSKVSFRPIEWVLAPAPWGEGRIVMIGDAAHSNPPVLAQGAAMGIEDAVVLADELSATPDDIDGALRRFISRRFERASFVVETSCQLSRWEVEDAVNVDIPGVMRGAMQRLAQPL